MSKESLYSEVTALQSKGVGTESDQVALSNFQQLMASLHAKYADKTPYDILGVDDATQELNASELSSKRLKLSTYLQTEMYKNPDQSDSLHAVLELVEDAYSCLA
ncbi:MAG: hypothetical protein P1U63_13265 [Coxiellaceae bacterium]|nr:hypothetical protein [Coxiellaceae bacterium]